MSILDRLLQAVFWVAVGAAVPFGGWLVVALLREAWADSTLTGMSVSFIVCVALAALAWVVRAERDLSAETRRRERRASKAG